MSPRPPLAEFRQALDEILGQKFAKYSKDKFKLVSDLFNNLHKSNPKAAARLQAEMAKPEHPLRQKLKAAFARKKSSTELVKHLSGRPERATRARSTRRSPRNTYAQTKFMRIMRQRIMAGGPSHPLWETTKPVLAADGSQKIVKNGPAKGLPERAWIKTPSTHTKRGTRSGRIPGTGQLNVFQASHLLTNSHSQNEKFALEFAEPNVRRGTDEGKGVAFKRVAVLVGNVPVELESARHLAGDSRVPNFTKEDFRKATRVTFDNYESVVPEISKDAKDPLLRKTRAKAPANTKPAVSRQKTRATAPEKKAVKSRGVPRVSGRSSSRATSARMSSENRGRNRTRPAPRGARTRAAKSGIAELAQAVANAGAVFARRKAYAREKSKKRHEIQKFRAAGFYVRLNAVFEVQNGMKDHSDWLNTSPLVAVGLESTPDPIAAGWKPGLAGRNQGPTIGPAAKNGKQGHVPAKDAFLVFHAIEILYPLGTYHEPSQLLLGGDYINLPVDKDTDTRSPDVRHGFRIMQIRPVKKLQASPSRSTYTLKDKADTIAFKLRINAITPKGTEAIYAPPNYFSGGRNTGFVNNHDFWSGNRPLEVKYGLIYPKGIAVYFRSVFIAEYDKNDLPYLKEKRWTGLPTHETKDRRWQFSRLHAPKSPYKTLRWEKMGNSSAKKIPNP